MFVFGPGSVTDESGVDAMSFLRVLVLFGVVAVFGCGSGAVEEVQPEPDDLNQMITQLLDEIIQSGSSEEAISDLRSYIEEDMVEIDEAKSQALLKDVEELAGMRSAAQIKAKAAEMKGKL